MSKGLNQKKNDKKQPLKTPKEKKLAKQENFVSVEHLKRYTTLGMATDQGKTANVTALAVMAELTGKTIPETGTTIFRPPYTGVALSTLGNGDTGTHFRPRRLTPTACAGRVRSRARIQGPIRVSWCLWRRCRWSDLHQA